MDENYLDSLLKGVSPDDKQNKKIDSAMDLDAGVDIDLSDLDGISLDELDDLDNLDLGDLDIDDIDFDDLDVTNLSAGTPKPVKEAEQDEDFNLDDIIREVEEEALQEELIAAEDKDASVNQEIIPEQPVFLDEVFKEADDQLQNDISFDEMFGDMNMSEQTEDFSNATLDSNLQENIEDTDTTSVQDMDLDDLFSALGIEGEGLKEDNYTSTQGELDELFTNATEFSFEDGDISDIQDIQDVKSAKKSKKKKTKSIQTEPKQKKTFSEILFGTPDEDDLEEEKLLEIERAKKQVDKEEKKAAKEAAKQEILQKKKDTDQKKKIEKETKKRAKEAQLMAELEAEKDQKKVSNPVVIIVFAIFIALLILVVLGTKHFNYSQVIKKAADYFDRQRYRLAYDEVSGVEVKEEDQELRDRIYTVMYVERLYESYENNMKLGRPDKALDSLIRGLEKYDEHYLEAVALDIVEDIDLCKTKIIDALWNTYGLTEDDAYRMMELKGQEYSDVLSQFSEDVKMGE